MRVSDAALTSAVNRGRRASDSIFGGTTSGARDVQQVMNKQQVIQVRAAKAVANSIASGRPIDALHAGASAQ